MRGVSAAAETETLRYLEAQCINPRNSHGSANISIKRVFTSGIFAQVCAAIAKPELHDIRFLEAVPKSLLVVVPETQACRYRVRTFDTKMCTSHGYRPIRKGKSLLSIVLLLLRSKQDAKVVNSEEFGNPK